MEVWVLYKWSEDTPGEISEIIGVYSTSEKAESEKAAREPQNPSTTIMWPGSQKPIHPWGPVNEYAIDPFMLDLG